MASVASSSKQHKKVEKSEFKYSVKRIAESVNHNKIIIRKTKFDSNSDAKHDSDRSSRAASPAISLFSVSSESDSVSTKTSVETARSATPVHDNDPSSASTVQSIKLQIPMDKLLERQCTICEAKIHQDKLYEHMTTHFYENSKCRFCDKVFSNPSSFVTHTSSHSGWFFSRTNIY
jgi:hypothetical protein